MVIALIYDTNFGRIWEITMAQLGNFGQHLPWQTSLPNGLSSWFAQLRRIFNSCRYTLPGTFYRCDAQQIKTHVPMEIYWAPQGWAIFGDTLTKIQFLQLEFLIRLSTKSVFTMKDRQGIAINSSGNRWGEVSRLITSYRHWQLRYCFNLEYFQRKNWHLGQ